MTRLLSLLLASAVPAFAQTTEFPGGASPLGADALKARFSEASYAFTDANGVVVGLQFKGAEVDVKAPRASDSGTWKIEGSAICFELQRFKSGCNEVRLLGDQLYWKRNSNGEVVKLQKS
jgi:hypothetical protein